MTDRDLPHLMVRGTVQTINGFVERRGFNPNYEPPPFPGGSRDAHAARLLTEMTAAANSPVEEREVGSRITFKSFPSLGLELEKLETRRSGSQPRLDSVRIDLVDGEEVEFATVFVPDSKRSYFIRKLTAYANSLAPGQGAANAGLVESIQSARLSILKDLWTDPPHLFPDTDHQVWWEVWLIDQTGSRLDELRRRSESSRVEIGSLAIGFGPQTVTLIRASRQNLVVLDHLLDFITELRLPAAHIEAIAGIEIREQANWSESIISRLHDNRPEDFVAVCVLDHIANRSHPLLQPFLSDQDVQVAVPTWSRYSTDGHGTEMAALALYHDLEAVAEGTSPVPIGHGLESVKLIPTDAEHARDTPLLHGGVTALAVDAVELAHPNRSRIFSLAVTAPHNDPEKLAHRTYLGNPTSWSATIDALAAGRQIDATADRFLYLNHEDEYHRRLFVVSAGNIRDLLTHRDHPNQNDIEIVENPGQAWNAITVGAFTNKDTIDERSVHADWRPIAGRGQISPSSRTSVGFDRHKWPVKPDVVAEGGNSAVDPSGVEVDTPEDLQVLTARHHWEIGGQFTTTKDTSAATASVAAVAGSVWAEYPHLWPETVRGLVVHSARWTPAMLADFREESRPKRAMLHRRYGMGVPNIGRALYSAQDSLTLIAEDRLIPYTWSDPKKPSHDGIFADMNLHDLPWPKESLEQLGDRQVHMRVTLSYFIEPNPSARGWRGRYAYPSFGLRFKVKHPLETKAEFNKRINQKATEQGEIVPKSIDARDRWWFGSQHHRGPGSIHTDIWTGSAAELASCNILAVYPISGWWKSNMKDREGGSREARYSLIVSIEAEGVEVELWTAVANNIKIEGTTV